MVLMLFPACLFLGDYLCSTGLAPGIYFARETDASRRAAFVDDPPHAVVNRVYCRLRQLHLDRLVVVILDLRELRLIRLFEQMWRVKLSAHDDSGFGMKQLNGRHSD